MLNNIFDEFNSCYRVKHEEPDVKALSMSNRLIGDELEELVEEFFEANTIDYKTDINIPNVAKEMADIIYITAQRMRTMGFDVDAILKEVHRSNMSKTVTTGTSEEQLMIARERYPEAYIQVGQNYSVLRCAATNKVIKPTTYSPAVITLEMIK